MNIAPYIDHTLLSPTARETDIRKLCEEAWTHQFKSVCIAPSYVKYAGEMLAFCPIPIEIGTVIGFPLGYNVKKSKQLECEVALQNGATELDIVMNISQFKSMAYLSVQQELAELAELIHAQNAIIKVIIETAYLDPFELRTACEICTEAKVDFIKTSTGFAPFGAEIETVKKIREITPQHIKIKASGGIKTYETAVSFIEAGADRLGTSSGVVIVSRP